MGLQGFRVLGFRIVVVTDLKGLGFGVEGLRLSGRMLGFSSRLGVMVFKGFGFRA